MFKVKLFFTWVKYKCICINLSNTHLNIKGFKCSRFGYKFSFDNWNLLILKLFIKNRKPLWFIDSYALPHLLFGQFDHYLTVQCKHRVTQYVFFTKNHDLHVTFVIALSLRGARDGKPLGPHLIQQRWNSLTTTKAAVWTTIYMLQISNTIIELHHSPQPQSHHI